MDLETKKQNVKVNPVIIIGFGGSGTRVISEILKNCKYNIGTDVNNSNDDLVFTFLFKFHKKYGNIKSINEKEINYLINIHYKKRLGLKLNFNEKIKIITLALNHVFINRYYNYRWVLKRLTNLFSKTKTNDADKWSFKEPHIIYFLKQILNYYDESKIIFVIRNGLDMVFSSNVQQYIYWGNFFNQEDTLNKNKNKFNYWYNFNKYALNILQEEKKDNYLIVKFEELISSPQKNIEKILKFLEIKEYNINKLTNLIKYPSSMKRFKKYDKSWIDNDIKSKLSEFGYEFD